MKPSERILEIAKNAARDETKLDHKHSGITNPDDYIALKLVMDPEKWLVIGILEYLDETAKGK